MEITENRKESILKAFNKFLESCKDSKGFNRRVNLIRKLEKEHTEFKDIDNYSFLEGSTGTVLTLMNCLYPERHSWIRHLLID